MNTIINQYDLGPELLGAISNLVCVIKDERIAYINTAGIRMLGASDMDAVLTHELAEFVHADYAKLVSHGIDVFSEEDTAIPLKLRPLNAPPIDVHMNVQRLKPHEDDIFMVECRDITSYIKASEEARQREQRLAGVLGTVVDAIVTIEPGGTVLTANLGAEKMFGYSQQELLNQNISTLMPTDFAERHNDAIARGMETGHFSSIGKALELLGKHKDGTEFPIEISVAELHEGQKHLFTGVIRDITERKKAQAEIEHLAHHDTLTGLPNRNLFNDLMERAIDRAARANQQMAVMFVDLDKFKPVNDDLGHVAGDAVLKSVAKRMAAHVRTSDTVARIGGDEFIAILENIDHTESAGLVAEKIIEALTEPVDIPEGKQAQIGASIGI
ncbi:MAG: GGDEF domain-containing protein, partial [Magnetovibrio sp.]|nr:GGDEF domain-containing protein [Magnetovibrio sp.]